MLLLSSIARADEPAVGLGDDGLAAVSRIGLPVADRPRLTFALGGEFGLENDLPEQDESTTRMGGVVGVGYYPVHWFGMAADYRLRSDQHPDAAGAEIDSAGDAGLTLRAGGRFYAAHVGVELSARMPGGDGAAPRPEGLSGELKFLLANRPEARGRVVGQVGFRIDRSELALDDPPATSADRFTAQLGEHNAFLMGLGIAYALDNARAFEVLGELGADVLVGTGRDELERSLLRGGLGLRVRASESVQLELMIEGSPSARGAGDFEEPLVEMAPRLASRLGVRVSLPTGRAPPPVAKPERRERAAFAPGRERAPVAPPEVNPYAEAIPKSPLEFAAADTTEDEPEPYTQDESEPAVDEAEPEPEPEAEPAEAPPSKFAVVRGYIRSFDGKPLPATAKLYPSGKKTKTDDNGYFELELKPGRYTVRLRAYGYGSQNRKIIARRNGVTVLNVELRKRR